MSRSKLRELIYDGRPAKLEEAITLGEKLGIEVLINPFGDEILEKDINFVLGDFGSGKTSVLVRLHYERGGFLGLASSFVRDNDFYEYAFVDELESYVKSQRDREVLASRIREAYELGTKLVIAAKDRYTAAYLMSSGVLGGIPFDYVGRFKISGDIKAEIVDFVFKRDVEILRNTGLGLGALAPEISDEIQALTQYVTPRMISRTLLGLEAIPRKIELQAALHHAVEEAFYEKRTLFVPKTVRLKDGEYELRLLGRSVSENSNDPRADIELLFEVKDARIRVGIDIKTGAARPGQIGRYLASYDAFGVLRFLNNPPKSASFEYLVLPRTLGYLSLYSKGGIEEFLRSANVSLFIEKLVANAANKKFSRRRCDEGEAKALARLLEGVARRARNNKTGISRISIKRLLKNAPYDKEELVESVRNCAYEIAKILGVSSVYASGDRIFVEA